jgi:hypothetical protein
MTSLPVSAQFSVDFLVSTGSLSARPDLDQFLDPSFLP